MANKTKQSKLINKLINEVGLEKLQAMFSQPKKKTKGQFGTIPGEHGFNHILRWFEEQIYTDEDDTKDRFARYSDIDYMLNNNSIISAAAEMFGSEGSMLDENNILIKVNTEDEELGKHITDLIHRWGFTRDVVREHLFHIAAYGDSLAIAVFEDPNDLSKGIDTFLHLSPFQLEKRIETNTPNFLLDNDLQRMLNPQYKDIASFFDEKGNGQTEAFNKHLLGFILNPYMQETEKEKRYRNKGKDEDKVFFPPWSIAHFRNFSSMKEFAPYGRSFFTSSATVFRQIKFIETLTTLARLLSLPKNIYEVDVGDSADQTEIWEAIANARSEFYNAVGDNTTKVDELSVLTETWLPKDLVDFDSIHNQLRGSDIHDLEYFQDQLLIGTSVPNGYITQDDRGWGESSLALLEQSKPFARKVAIGQSSFLKELTRMINIQLLLEGKIDTSKVEDSDFKFTLSLPFPIAEQDSTRVDALSDSLDLADDILSNIVDLLGGRDAVLPTAMIADVLKKYTFLTDKEVDEWFAMIDKDKNKVEESQADKKKRQVFTERIQDMTPTQLKKQVNKAVFKQLRESKAEGMITRGKNGRNMIVSRVDRNDATFALLKNRLKSRVVKG